MSAHVRAQPGLANTFEVGVEAVDGDYARVTVHATDPRGGFGGYVKREHGAWEVVILGSAFNPEALASSGIPPSLWP